jgi:hypothetical protein
MQPDTLGGTMAAGRKVNVLTERERVRSEIARRLMARPVVVQPYVGETGPEKRFQTIAPRRRHRLAAALEVAFRDGGRQWTPGSGAALQFLFLARLALAAALRAAGAGTLYHTARCRCGRLGGTNNGDRFRARHVSASSRR